MHNFFPALRASTASKNLVLNQLEKVTLGLKFSGTLVKMLYAFLWQVLERTSLLLSILPNLLICSRVYLWFCALLSSACCCCCSNYKMCDTQLRPFFLHSSYTATQEWVFVFGPKGELMLRPRMNELGATLMPGVNTLANMLTGYVHTDPSVQVTCNSLILCLLLSLLL